MNSENPYHNIGVQPFINCCGTRTIHSGTLMLPEVKAAMLAASNHFVNMDELMAGVSKRLAALTGADWAIVTSGASASLCHATAAAVTGGDPEKIMRLPNTTGLKNRVVMMADGRFTYDQAIRTAGVEVVEVQPDSFAGALDETIAMAAFLGSREAERLDKFEKMVALARAKKIPVLVDAASEHLQQSDPYLARGASMVAYSGGKYLRGPQASGLLLGEKAWLEAAWCCAAPHHTLGRAMKIGREEVMGLLAAVEYWAEKRDHDAEQARWNSDLATISRLVGQVKNVTTAIMPGESIRSSVPRLEIRWDAQQIGLSGLALRDLLLNRTPRIMLDDRGASAGSVLILPFSLQPGEAQVVGQSIRDALASASAPQTSTTAAAVDIGGTWEICIAFTGSEAIHRWEIAQTGDALSGAHQTLFLNGSLSGSVMETTIDVVSQIRCEGTHLAYRFRGTVTGETASGTVELGSSGQSAPGPLNQQEYGSAAWHGKRL